jgi:hypothetical protein
MTVDNLWRNFEILGSPVVRYSMVDRFIAMNPELNAAIVQGIQYGTGVVKVPYVWSMLPHINTAMEKVIMGIATPAEALQEAYEITRENIYSLF